MIRISKEEQKLFIISVAGLIIIIFFWVFIYTPKNKVLAALKKKVAQNEAFIKDIKSLIGENTPLEQGVAVLRQQAVLLSYKSLDQKDIFRALSRISESASIAGVKIVSVNPGTPSVFSAKTGTAPKHNNKSCYKTVAKVEVEGPYADLANYLFLLEHSPVGIYTVDGFSILKDEKIAPDLKMTLSLGIYVFGD